MHFTHNVVFDFQICEKPATSLGYMINARNPAIVTDAQLSILKVAEVEITPPRELYSDANEQHAGVSKSHVRSLHNDEGSVHSSANSSLFNLSVVYTYMCSLLIQSIIVHCLYRSNDIIGYFCWR